MHTSSGNNQNKPSRGESLPSEGNSPTPSPKKRGRKKGSGEGATLRQEKENSRSDPKYSKAYKQEARLSSYLEQALIGLLLGDVHASRGGRQTNARLVFDQSKIEHSNYIYYLYELFKSFVVTEPKSTNRTADKRTGNVYDSLIFITLAFPCFNKFYDLFYPSPPPRHI